MTGIKKVKYFQSKASGNEQHSMHGKGETMHMKCMKCNGRSALCESKKKSKR